MTTTLPVPGIQTTDRTARVAGLVVTLLAAALVLAAVFAQTQAAGADRPDTSYIAPASVDGAAGAITFGCAEVMVASNVDCDPAQAADAMLADTVDVATTRYGCAGADQSLAPWCTPAG